MHIEILYLNDYKYLCDYLYTTNQDTILQTTTIRKRVILAIGFATQFLSYKGHL